MDNSKGKKAVPKSGNPRIITMDSLRNSDQDERQAYFAGGSEHSGQQILGRAGRGEQDESGEALAQAFRRASSNRNNLTSEEPRTLSFRDGQTFRGVGYRLGDAESPQNDNRQNYSSPQPQTESSVSGRIILTLWQNGYNFDNGPLQSYDDPRCAQLMTNIDRGELPTNLLPYDRGDSGPVHLSVVDKRGEKFKKSLQLFGGKGHKLGSPTPMLSTCQSSLQESQSNLPTVDLNPSENSSNDGVLFDDDDEDGSNSDDMDYSHFLRTAHTRNSPFHREGHVLESNSGNRCGPSHNTDKPFTVDGPTDFSDGDKKKYILKLRLPDGNILQITVADCSTIGQVKQYIKQCVSGLEEKVIILQLSYPRRDLTDDEVVTCPAISNSLLVLQINV